MPRLRQTCTRCSMRRQKCDRRAPCDRCVAAGVANACSREWRGGYDAAVHRRYPKSGIGRFRAASSSQPSGESSGSGDAFPQVGPDNEGSSSLADAADAAHMDMVITEVESLRPLLPKTDHLLQLVNYHESNLLWYHWSLSMPLFRQELSQALQATGSVQLCSTDLRWVALLFAIISGSMTCGDDATAASWGYRGKEKLQAGRAWFDASLKCLRLENYMARPHMASIQAILVLSPTAHILGHSAEIFSMLGVAIRLAQTLGLHKLPHKEDVDALEHAKRTRLDEILSREVGRRVWIQLRMHDSYAVAFTDMYFIHERHNTTSLPRRIDDETIAKAPESSPHYADWTIWLFHLSNLVVQYHDSTAHALDDEALYQKALDFDARIRSLLLPACFDVDTGISWARWAKQETTIVRSSKIGYIHRRFLRRSFTDDRYAYSRWASIEAARAVIQEVETAWTSEPTRPSFWNDQAHMIAACVTLCLDILHRTRDDPEYRKSHTLVASSLDLLRSKDDSAQAMRGARMISSLLHGDLPHFMQSLASPKDREAVHWPLIASEDIETLQSKLTHPPPTAKDEISAFDSSAMTVDVPEDIFTDLAWIDMLLENPLSDFGFDVEAL